LENNVCQSQDREALRDLESFWQVFHIFTFRTTACPSTKLATIVLGVLKKCIFLKPLDIQDDCPCLLLAEITSMSPEPLHVKSPDLSEMFL
jgi:hypothetical protein